MNRQMSNFGKWNTRDKKKSKTNDGFNWNIIGDINCEVKNICKGYGQEKFI